VLLVVLRTTKKSGGASPPDSTIPANSTLHFYGGLQVKPAPVKPYAFTPAAMKGSV
jgi:hypothetical protein